MIFTWEDHELTFSAAEMNYAQKYKIARSFLLNKNTYFEKNYDKAEPQELNQNILQEFADCYIKTLIKKGYYDINLTAFKNKYLPSYGCCTETVHAQYLLLKGEIDETEANEIAYRAARKAGRGKIIGGGFGVSGATKGILTAGAINATTGMAHSFVNAIGNAVTRSHATNERIKLKHDIKPDFWNALCEDVLNFFNAYIYALSDIFAEIYELPSAEKRNSSYIIFDNIKNGEIEYEFVKDSIANIFQKNPYNEKAYEFALMRYGDEKGELQNLSDHFCGIIDVYKKEIFTKIYDKWEGEKSYDSAIIAINKIKKAVKQYGIKDEIWKSKYTQIENYILLCCTYKGVVYANPDEVEKKKLEEENARKEQQRQKTLLENLFSHTDNTSVETIQKTIDEMEKLQIPEKASYIKQLLDRIEHFDEYNRTFDGKCYDTIEEKNIAMKEKNFLLQMQKQLENPSLNNLIYIILQVEKFSFKFYDASKFLSEAYFHYDLIVDEQDFELFRQPTIDNYTDFKSFYLTVDNKKYTSIQEANVARQEKFSFLHVVASHAIATLQDGDHLVETLKTMDFQLINKDAYMEKAIVTIAQKLSLIKCYSEAIVFLERNVPDIDKRYQLRLKVSNYIKVHSEEIKKALASEPTPWWIKIGSLVFVFLIAKLASLILPFFKTIFIIIAFIFCIFLIFGMYLDSKDVRMQQAFISTLRKQGYIFIKEEKQ